MVAGTSVRLLDDQGTLIGSTVSDNAGNYSFPSVAPGSYRVEFQSTGFKKNVVSQLNVGPGENLYNNQLQVGSTAQSIEVTAGNSMLNTFTANANSTNSLPVANRAHIGGGPGGGFGVAGGIAGREKDALLEAAREMSAAAASGQELGDLFEYKLKDRVTLKKNQSALVPIAQTEIEAEKVSLWNSTAYAGRPLRALWLKNTSSLTLDGGSFNVLESEVFAGEGLTDPIKPGERRLLSYATDLGLLVETQHSSQPQQITNVKIAKGVMTQTSELRESTLYTVRNQDDTARVLVIEQPVRPGALLAKGTKEPDERAPGVYRFKLDVPAKTTASLPVEEFRVLQSNFQLAGLNEEQIALFSKNGTITPEMKEALEKVAAQQAVVAKLEQDMEDRQKDIDRIVADQERLRENMKALRGSSEEKALLQRYTGELDQQETQLDTLRKKIQATEAERDKANDQLEDTIANVSLEASF